MAHRNIISLLCLLTLFVSTACEQSGRLNYTSGSFSESALHTESFGLKAGGDFF